MSQRIAASISSFVAIGATVAMLSFAGAVTTEAAAQSFTVYQAAGANAADIQGTVDRYRTALGNLNQNNPGSVGSGRREINWDGVPDENSDPALFPPDFFNANLAGRARGAVFSTPSRRLMVSTDSQNPTNTPVEYGRINPTYPGQFATFSPPRLFTALGSRNIVDVHFFIPGSNTRATTTGFGAVFTDVDLANRTSIAYYDRRGRLLRWQWVPARPGAGTLSFAGVVFRQPVVWRVRIISGTIGLGPNDNPSRGRDVVVMDDFIYGEPRR